ncbi:lysophospholipid acyltransferase family protein [Flavobacterium capsici]|uniref:Lysophospholipid acyltransferase family protein n=1 Tax=Flavobacterium capsici TaxID=3075618 RepID=A0AA96F0F0_9FLAO|nr:MULTISPECIES: lysophospholipid acyltransferase family protein [unclassified Flavobacterium]WNM20342.1 lysophospholipid acyltransferase family protein [Flavobacterium sp. PMR2A8]WNM21732.1 lysophospholipid acyltransferase family protein [Flavobacterium sp. PMTSA4]
MQFVLFCLLYPILYLISILPFRLLYLFSDFVFFLVYHVFGYRKKVVRTNLALALPHLSEKERLDIEKKSYQHLCDMFLEMMKTMTISTKEIQKRFVFTNLEMVKELEKKQKSIALMCAHYASYEWVISMNGQINYQGYAIYKKVNNKYFDDLVKKIRSRFKAYLITTRETRAVIENNERNGNHAIYGFASDQSPQIRPKTYWSKFMGIEVPVYVGAELISKKYDMSVVFLKVEKVKRGHYEAKLELLSDDVKSVPDFEITEIFNRKVEAQILEKPEYYLWTHKRWKHMGKKKTN